MTTPPDLQREAPAPEAVPAAAPDFPLSRMLRFGSIVSAILLAANAFVCATWSCFFDWPGWLAWQLLPGVLALAFIPATILRFRSAHPALRVTYAVCATWLGALNFAFFAAAACWIAEGVFLLAGRPAPRFDIAAIFFGLALLVTLGGLINASWLRVTRITVPLPNLPEPWRGRTAVLVTDLHLGPLSGAPFLRRVLARIRGLNPDLVFISGDMFDGPTLGLRELTAPWRDFSAPLGIFFVTGNHDEFAERGIYLDAVRSCGIRVLDNEAVTLDGVDLVGVHDDEASDPAQLRAILQRVHADKERPAILLAHRPVNLRVAEEEGIALQLSGHTHHGQLWPWNLLVRRIYGPYAYGLHRHGQLWVNTCSGTGTWGPPLRVATKSEIVLIRFEAER
jgi:predicted MPP superfamily phosphohydrolase